MTDPQAARKTPACPDCEVTHPWRDHSVGSICGRAFCDRTDCNHDDRPVAARETLRPDPLTPDPEYDKAWWAGWAAATENARRLALRAATPDPAEPRETLRPDPLTPEMRAALSFVVDYIDWDQYDMPREHRDTIRGALRAATPDPDRMTTFAAGEVLRASSWNPRAATPDPAEPDEHAPLDDHDPTCPMFDHPNDRTAPGCTCATPDPAEPRGQAVFGCTALGCALTEGHTGPHVPDRAASTVEGLREALLDIEEMSKGDPMMGGAYHFSGNHHRMGQIHNRVRVAFGEEPVRIHEVDVPGMAIAEALDALEAVEQYDIDGLWRAQEQLYIAACKHIGRRPASEGGTESPPSPSSPSDSTSNEPSN